MEEEPSMLKGLLNDLTRTLFSSAIFLDDLHLNLQPDSEFYDAWWQANEQLKRAIEFFLELRSTCIWHLIGQPGERWKEGWAFPQAQGPDTPLCHGSGKFGAC
jgi:hypothetical protein